MNEQKLTPMGVEEAARVLRGATMLRRWGPLPVIVSLLQVWQIWHTRGHVQAFVLFACLLAVLLGLAGFVPWFLRRTVDRRGVIDETD